MIDSSELDALVVVTPEDLLHPMVMAGVEAGLHVLCEKPMAFTADQSAEMLAAARRARVKHMVQFTNRGLPHYRWIKHLLEDGYVGTPYHAYFTWPTGWFPAEQPNPYFWWADARRAKGAANELGSHMIDLALWFLGDVNRVSASLRTFAPRIGLDGEPMDTANDSAMLLLDFANGAHGLLHVGSPNIAGTGLRHIGQTVVISGSNGTLEACWDGSTPPVSTIVGIRRGQSTAEELAVPYSYFAGADRGRPFSIFEKQSVGPRLFVDAILEDRSLRPDFGDGHAVQCIVEAAFTRPGGQERHGPGEA
jgi:predicted dehydrogenase